MATPTAPGATPTSQSFAKDGGPPWPSTPRSKVEELHHGNWRLTADLVYQGKYDSFTIPKGFETDFASVPRLFRWLVPTSGEYTKAAVVHDFLWRTNPADKRVADNIFRRMLRELEVPVLRRYVMWGTVRIGSLLRGARLREILVIVLLALLVLPVALPATVIVLTVLAVLWVVEMIIWLVARLFGKKLVRPRAIWWA
jgi:hypothetical protein